jgi:hypothetical protein
LGTAWSKRHKNGAPVSGNEPIASECFASYAWMEAAKSEENMSEEQFNQLMTQMAHIDKRFDNIDRKFDRIDQRFEYLEENMVKKSDVFQSVLIAQGFMFAIVVGVVVILNTVIGFG